MMRLPALMVIAALSISACETSTGSATEHTICRELGRELPTYSPQDTDDTKSQGVRFLTVYRAVCP